MDPVQYILLLIILSFLLKTANNLRKNKIHFADFLLWLLFWGVVSLIVIFPYGTQVVADVIGVGRGADLIVYIGMLGVYYFLYLMLVKIKSLDHKITLLGRSIALDKAVDTTKPDVKK
jgi:hypothetical protein